MHNKVVIITGGTSGIGRALAKEFGSHGSKILITGRNQESLDNTVQELTEKGITVQALRADASSEDDNKAMAHKAIESYGKIDVLINNAGISMRALFEDLNLTVIKQVMDINFYGAIYATKYCLPHILNTKGSIVGISSIAGYRGLPARTGYSASKFALQGFLEALRAELLKSGVHVLIACPGYTASNIRKSALTQDGKSQQHSPLDESKQMSAERCAQLVYKATLKRKKILTLTFQGKMAVILNKWFPVWMDRLVYNKLAKEEDSPFK